MMLRRRTDDEGGYVSILVAAFIAFLLLPLCAISVDVARWYVEVQRVQNAADSAAMAGVTYLPDDFAAAQSAAIAMATRNGFPNSGDTSVVVAMGAKPTQLKVTISSTISNTFGATFGIDLTTITRSAVADYNGPAPMGSPCNTFGNEPPGTTNAGPVGSQLSPPVGGATCSTNPQFWTAIAGPDTPKGNGDRFMTRTCGTGNDGCTGTTNDEFDPAGYFYVVRAGAAAVGSTVSIQIYDPAWVSVGDDCTAGPTGTINNNNWNDWANTDAIARYARTAGSYCPGDVDNGTGTNPIVTSFGLRRPTDTYNPINGQAITNCAKQYPGYLVGAVTDNRLKKGHAQYNDGLARVFRQWTTLCSFTVTEAGDYYLQVRTNLKLGISAADANGKYTGLDSGGAVTGTQAEKIYTQNGDDTTVKGTGNNRFAMRITGAPANSMSIAGWEQMSIYMNYSGAVAEFNLVRVIPAAANKTLTISFFDVGDASNPGTITILPPLDGNMGATIPMCVGTGPRAGNLPGCQLTNVSSGSGFNGKLQTVKIPIPNGYTCTYAQAGGCWFRIRFSFTGSVPNDTTTWTAAISGDPIRLIE